MKPWKKFPKSVQDLLQSTATETQNWEREEINKVEGELLSEMEADGMTVTRLTPEQQAAFKEKMSAVWEKYGGKLGDDLVKSVVDTK